MLIATCELQNIISTIPSFLDLNKPLSSDLRVAQRFCTTAGQDPIDRLENLSCAKVAA